MGEELFESSRPARAVFERADAALEWSVSKLCFEGPPEALQLTANTQPALVTVSIAALEALKEAFPDLDGPAFVAGHSLGEYSALVAAGALDFEDAVRLVHLRGQAMQEAVPTGVGSMAAIMADDATVRALCSEAAQGEVLAPANYNAPGQTVIAGHAAAVARATELAQARKVKVMALKVSAPFHCSLMQPAADRMRLALAGISIRPPRWPVVANVTGEPTTVPDQIRELLVRQVDGCVRWEQSVRWMADQGVTQALEIGSGRVLSGLVKRIDRRISVLSVGDVEALEEAKAFFGGDGCESAGRSEPR
ncbi:MAG: ACP S-malonyltransferase [Polyangiaceae bacterium]|nr:ACP S-malonyltransferase [Polyangiaceae bacterium]